MKIFSVFLAFSVLLHILGLLLLPAFNVMTAKALEVIPITLEVWEKEYKKPIPENIQTTQKPKPEEPRENTIPQPKPKPQTTLKPEQNQNKPDDVVPQNIPSAPNIGFTTPSIDPDLITATQSNIDALIGNLTKDTDNKSIAQTKTNADKLMLERLKEELASNTPAENIGKSDQELVAKELQNSSGAFNSDFISFDVYPSNNRRITYAPEKPEFSLPNNTSIKIKITVDKNGNVQNIVLLTRNTAQVERLSLSYVEKLKFEASDKIDEAQLTLTFKVRSR